MQVKVIKTKRNAAPMQQDTNFSVVEYPVYTKQFKQQGKRLINVYPGIEYQTVKGFGGAFTESASTTLDKLSPEKRDQVIKLYFDENEGIGYTIGRVHMNSCDFSLDNYTCVDEGDETLETFQIERDKASVIPMIKDALKYNPDLAIFASPWSPPAYMKDNKEKAKFEGAKLGDVITFNPSKAYKGSATELASLLHITKEEAEEKAM